MKNSLEELTHRKIVHRIFSRYLPKFTLSLSIIHKSPKSLDEILNSSVIKNRKFIKFLDINFNNSYLNPVIWKNEK